MLSLSRRISSSVLLALLSATGVWAGDARETAPRLLLRQGSRIVSGASSPAPAASKPTPPKKPTPAPAKKPKPAPAAAPEPPSVKPSVRTLTPKGSGGGKDKPPTAKPAGEPSGSLNSKKTGVDSTLRITSAIQQLLDEAALLFNQGTVEGFQQAAAKYAQAYEGFYGVFNKQGQALAAYNAGAAYVNAKEYDKALVWWEEKALALYKEVGPRKDEGDVLEKLANLQVTKGAPVKGADLYQSAATIYEEIKIPNKRAECLFLAGRNYTLAGDNAKAQAAYATALEIYRATPDKLQEMNVLRYVGFGYRGANAWPQALEAFQSALVLARELNHKEVADLLNLIGVAYTQTREYQKALDSHQEALSIFQARNYDFGIKQTQSYIEQAQTALANAKP